MDKRQLFERRRSLNMVEIRMHGRGGQGVVLASEILAHALFLEGKEVQSFPSFGAERRGAPVVAFIRCDTKPIRKRTEIRQPDHVVVMAPVLLDMGVSVSQGLKNGGTLLLNYSGDPQSLSEYADFNVYVIDAIPIAVKYRLGTAIAPIVNCVIVGAFVGATSLVSIEGVSEAISRRISVRPEDNILAAREAAKAVRAVAWERKKNA
jgi:2-oxoacid:acceptor oxidoreductase gamma subunit (pyruvate/2-ketoisovalerate family)